MRKFNVEDPFDVPVLGNPFGLQVVLTEGYEGEYKYEETEIPYVHEA